MRIITTYIPDTTTLDHFTRLTCDFITNGELGKLKACFDSIEVLLQNGETSMKDAIHKVYIPSLAAYIHQYHIETPVVNLMPYRLYREYRSLWGTAPE